MGTGGIDGGDGIVGGGEDLGGGAFKGGLARVESEADGALPPRPLRLPPRPLAPRRRTFLKDSLKVGSAARFTGSPRRGMPVHTGAFISPANSALMHSFLSMSEAALLSVSAFARRATERGEGVNIAAPRQNIRCGAAPGTGAPRRISSRGPSGATAQDGAAQPHHTARFPKVTRVPRNPRSSLL